jgi:hypothetical protein
VIIREGGVRSGDASQVRARLERAHGCCLQALSKMRGDSGVARATGKLFHGDTRHYKVPG